MEELRTVHNNLPDTPNDSLLDHFSEQLASLPQSETENLMSCTREIVNTLVCYKELRMMYACALKEVRTKFDVLDTEFKVRYQRNPISSITTRLKSNASTMDKLARKGLTISPANIEEHIFDLAGIRVVCSYIDDIYYLADALMAQDDITTLAVKDYIKNPKPNGYRSLHVIIEVPVFFCEQKKAVKVEVQIRTIAMDFWASLEHQLKYKQNIPDQQTVASRLKCCADKIMEVEDEMLDLRCHLSMSSDVRTEEDDIFDQLIRLESTVE